jgi:hypothetical protein
LGDDVSLHQQDEIGVGKNIANPDSVRHEQAPVPVIDAHLFAGIITGCAEEPGAGLEPATLRLQGESSTS